MNVNASNMPSLELANNALTAKMIYESQRRKHDSLTGTKIFAAGKNSTNSKNAINDINTIYSGNSIYTQLTLACATLDIDLIEKIIELGADVNLSPLNYYLDNTNDDKLRKLFTQAPNVEFTPFLNNENELRERLASLEKSKGKRHFYKSSDYTLYNTPFHNSPLYELIKATMNHDRFNYDINIRENFKKAIQLFIREGAEFTYNTPFNLYTPEPGKQEYQFGFDFYVKGLKIPLNFFIYLIYRLQSMVNNSQTAIGAIIFKLICQEFTEDSKAKQDFLKGDLSVLRDDLQKTFLDIYDYKRLMKETDCISSPKGGSRRRKNHKNSKKRNARRSKTLKR